MVVHNNKLFVGTKGNGVFSADINQLNCLVTNKNESEDVSYILISPNPFSTILNLKLPELGSKNATLSLYSLSGKLVYQKYLPHFSANISINLEAIADGIYIISIENEEINYHSKLIKNSY
jgi:hypothetical protein